jgi:hypothetical protein
MPTAAPVVTVSHAQMAMSAMTDKSTLVQLESTLLRKTWAACPARQVIDVPQLLAPRSSALVANTLLADQAAARAAQQTTTRNQPQPTAHPFPQA